MNVKPHNVSSISLPTVELGHLVDLINVVPSRRGATERE